MQFGLLMYCEFTPGMPESFSLLCAEAQAAEQAGFDLIELIEHHQGMHGEFSSPLIWLTALAARTRTIKLGTGVALLPLYHPVRLAEELSALDIISNGRIVFGAGLGYQEADFNAFSVPVGERVGRFREALQILNLAWQEPAVTFTGKHYSLQGIKVVSKPLRRRIPIWGGGMTEKAIKRVARECDGWIAPSNVTLQELEHLVGIYRSEVAVRGLTPHIILHRNGYVAATREQAIAEYEPALAAHYQALHHKAGSAVLGDLPGGTASAALSEDRCILGAPVDCVRQIAAYRDRLGIDGLVLRMRTTFGPEHSLVLRAIETFGRVVIPHFR